MLYIIYLFSTMIFSYLHCITIDWESEINVLFSNYVIIIIIIVWQQIWFHDFIN